MSASGDAGSAKRGPGLLVTVLVAGFVSAVTAGFVSVVVVTVVMTAGKNLLPHETVVEEDSASVPLQGSKGEMQVYYQRPFATPPKLTFPEGLGGCAVTEQQPDSFKLTRDVTGHTAWVDVVTVKWRAEGTPAR